MRSSPGFSLHVTFQSAYTPPNVDLISFCLIGQDLPSYKWSSVNIVWTYKPLHCSLNSNVNWVLFLIGWRVSPSINPSHKNNNNNKYIAGNWFLKMYVLAGCMGKLLTNWISYILSCYCHLNIISYDYRIAVCNALHYFFVKFRATLTKTPVTIYSMPITYLIQWQHRCNNNKC